MQSTGPDRQPRTRDQLLRDVYARSRQLWWRRRILPGMASVVVLLAAAVTPLVLHDGDAQRRVAAVTSPTEEAVTTTSPPPADTTTTEVPGPATTVARTTTRPKPTATTAQLVCRNSYDPSCGPFRWDPDPGPNQPSTAQITYSPAHPRVGEQITFHVTFTNPDGPADACTDTTDYGDGMSSTTSCSVLAPPGGCKTPYGPWTPPDRKADTFPFDDPGHAYKAPGTYKITVSGEAGLDPCDQPMNPYRDPKSATTTIVVSQ